VNVFSLGGQTDNVVWSWLGDSWLEKRPCYSDTVGQVPPFPSGPKILSMRLVLSFSKLAPPSDMLFLEPQS